jgi:hypothetical protein
MIREGSLMNWLQACAVGMPMNQAYPDEDLERI